MILSDDWISPTRATGMVAYGLAFVCCGIVWARSKGSSLLSRLAALLTLLEGFLFLDICLNLRWKLHQVLMDKAIRENLYGERRGPQAVVLGALVLVIFLTVMFTLRRLRDRPAAALAAAGGLLSIVLWCTEVVSLHAVDSITGHRVGPWLAISLMWSAACLITCLGILAEARANKRL